MVRGEDFTVRDRHIDSRRNAKSPGPWNIQPVTVQSGNIHYGGISGPVSGSVQQELTLQFPGSSERFIEAPEPP